MSSLVRDERIHRTALVDPRARVHPSVRVGPYAVVAGDVEIGEGTVIGPHVVLEDFVRIGRRNRIYTGAVIGCEPQDKTFHGERSHLFMGDDNVVREYAQISRATGEDAATVVGDRNYIMSTVHVAHNCRLGSDVVIVTGTGLAGHVQVGDGVQVGGITGVHQYVRIGRLAMVGGKTALTQDLPPFLLANGVPARVRGLNRVGLQRAGISQEEIERLRGALRILYRMGLTTRRAVDRIATDIGDDGVVGELLAFLRENETARRGLTRFRREVP